MAKFCTNCGAKIEANEEKCLTCGKVLKYKNESINETKKEEVTKTTTTNQQKNKVLAALFGIFLGCFGVHNFYLGYTNKAVAQLILGTAGWVLCGLGPIIASVWGFVEGIMILTGSINKDADGNDLTN